jgi:hypothetical protein
VVVVNITVLTDPPSFSTEIVLAFRQVEALVAECKDDFGQKDRAERSGAKV